MAITQTPTLQVFRSLATLAIIFHHVILSIFYYQKIKNTFIEYLVSLDKYGLNFFIILSDLLFIIP